jgi:hypothetical protein
MHRTKCISDYICFQSLSLISTNNILSITQLFWDIVQRHIPENLILHQQCCDNLNKWFLIPPHFVILWPIWTVPLPSINLLCHGPHFQCLLCSGKLPQECVVEVHQFVQTHPQLQGNLSVQVLCVPIEEAATILLDFCPHALLQYTKVTKPMWMEMYIFCPFACACFVICVWCCVV